MLQIIEIDRTPVASLCGVVTFESSFLQHESISTFGLDISHMFLIFFSSTFDVETLQ